MGRLDLEKNIKRINKIGIDNVEEERPETLETEEVEEEPIEEDTSVKSTTKQVKTPKTRADAIVENKLIEAQSDAEKQLAKTQTVVNDNISRAIEKTVDTADNVRQMTRDLTYLKGASDLQTNDKFAKQYQTELAGQLINDLKNEGTRQAIIDDAKKLEARNLRNQAYYNGFRDMFQMMRINAPFGLVPMVLLTIVILPIYLVFKIFDFLFNGINELLCCISEFRKPAKAFSLTIIIIALTVLVVAGILWLLDVIFGLNLLEMVREWVATL